jgi:hypothetical protein
MTITGPWKQDDIYKGGQMQFQVSYRRRDAERLLQTITVFYPAFAGYFFFGIVKSGLIRQKYSGNTSDGGIN